MTTPQGGDTPGQIALLGSGEATATGRRVLSRMLPLLSEPRAIAVLDSPAGFQPNHIRVAQKVADFITEKVAEARPRPRVIETRRDALDTPAGEAALRAIAAARCIVAGPGSPSYMIQELRDTAYLDAIRQANLAGTAIYVSSAATIAMSAFSVPVYEIFKVGVEPYWNDGLDLLGPFGMRLALVPHWNNSEGGAEVDTRFCYMGKDRFETLRAKLPDDVVMLGIDEHTACILDFATGAVAVEGKGGARVVRDDEIIEFANGEFFPMTLLGAAADESAAFRAGATDRVISAPVDAPLPAPQATLDPWIEEDHLAARIPPVLVDTVLAVRTDLRTAKQFAFADRLRDALVEAGIAVEDTPDGPRWHVAEEE
jgi:cyanophycinase-like exopeptidase